jgi:hypothetical protein
MPVMLLVLLLHQRIVQSLIGAGANNAADVAAIVVGGCVCEGARKDAPETVFVEIVEKPEHVSANRATTPVRRSALYVSRPLASLEELTLDWGMMSS